MGPGLAFPSGLCSRRGTQLSSLAPEATPCDGALCQPAGQPADLYYTLAMKTQAQEQLEARGPGRPQVPLEGPGSCRVRGGGFTAP